MRSSTRVFLRVLAGILALGLCVAGGEERGSGILATIGGFFSNLP